MLVRDDLLISLRPPFGPRPHAVSLEMLGARSPAQVVTGRGEPWLDERL